MKDRPSSSIVVPFLLIVLGMIAFAGSAPRREKTTLRFADASKSEASDAREAETLTSGRPDKHAKVDPIEANGPIFVDWPTPDAVLLFSGEQGGYLEPCGCAGLNNQKGGLKRRHTLIKQLEAKRWPVVAFDVGGQVRRFGDQAEIKFRHAIDSLIEIGVGAVGFGTQDLRMHELLPVVLNLPDGKNPFVSANVGILDFDMGLTKRFKVIEAGGLRIGVTSVLGKKQIAKLRNVEDIVIEEPYQAIPKILFEMSTAACDHLVLLAYADHEEAEDLARRFHEFDWVVAAKGADEPPNVATPIVDPKKGEVARLIEVGHKGMYVVAIGLYKDGPVPYRYQRIPIDHRFEDSPEMQAIFLEYQSELRTRGLEGLGLKPIDHPTGREFAGTEACADCHGDEYEIHLDTPHAHATQTLVDLDPPRHFDPECLSCHATGWEPQKFFPFESGYLGLQATPHLTGNGCENCHGPAKRHVDAENGDIDVSDEEVEQLRAALHLEIVENEGNQEGQVFHNGSVVEMCMQCHDLDNSPDFDFQEYWIDVAH